MPTPTCIFPAASTRRYELACFLVLFVFQPISLAWASPFDFPSGPNLYRPSEPTTAAEKFGQTIRDTDRRSPREEAAGFHLPDGFRIDLIASEPTIAKPMNMAFDGKGRLWVTQSTQYPFPTKAGEPATDSIIVLEDLDHDGSFESSKIFATDLNIPIGLLPVVDGVLCFSIPNLWYLRDNDKDGKCDERQVLYGPFDTSRDTHGMVNSLRDGNDGWIYACHGFNNESKVQGTDGHLVSMTSGNSFRFRLDGSRIEQMTQGQVNPFGLAKDRWGFWYAADCHSKPISQLIAGGCYPSFGRVDDGLGFVPPMMDHLHGSTAISGLAHTMNSRFPIAFEDNLVSGNVMTCRINRNRLEYSGATAKAIAMPDLLTSDDPWFRPVDLQFGPDGGLYVADFYNKVIGHYEVPLDHPDRDRTSGRIWRIRWEGKDVETIMNVVRKASTSTSQSQVDDLLNRSSLEARERFEHLANRLNRVDSDQRLSSNELDAILRYADSLDRVGEPSSAMVLHSIASLVAMASKNAESKIQSTSASWLLGLFERIDADNDPILNQTILIGLRDVLQSMQQSDSVVLRKWLDETTSRLVNRDTNSFSIESPQCKSFLKVLLAINNPNASASALSLVEKQIDTRNQGNLDVLLERMSDSIDESNMDRFLRASESLNPDPTSSSQRLLSLAMRQKRERGAVSERMIAFGHQRLETLCGKWLADANMQRALSPEFQLIRWFGNEATQGDPIVWKTEAREVPLIEGSSSMSGLFFSSLTLGERFAGTWSTAPFPAPKQINFELVGHNGLPSGSDQRKNVVRLLLVSPSGDTIQELATAFPPRSDRATAVRWDMSEHVGKLIRIQVLDEDTSESYAWMGVGGFQIEGLNPSSLRLDWNRILSFVETFGWPTQADDGSGLSSLLRSDLADLASRMQLNEHRYRKSQGVLVELVEFAMEHNGFDLLNSLANDVESQNVWHWEHVSKDQIQSLAVQVAKRCSAKEQEKLLSRLSRTRIGTLLIQDLCTGGSLSRDGLGVLPESFWQGLGEDDSLKTLVHLRPTQASVSQRQKVVTEKAASAKTASMDLEVGKKQFEDRCASCHKLGSVGKVVGPQLEGVGTRGVDRLCEDILWPDRNVDEAFRISMVLLDDGETLIGLVTDKTDESLMLTDQQGKQRRILAKEIDQIKMSQLSLMPGNFEELMTDKELASLIGYLKQEALTVSKLVDERNPKH
jgi:putative heme-binding domain-containing protein